MTIAARRAELEASGEIMSTDDRINQLAADNPDWSNRRIAREVGVSPKTVDRRMAKSASNSEIPKMTQPVTIWNPTPREERALKDDRVIERMKETGGSAVSARQRIQAEDKAERKAYTLEKP